MTPPEGALLRATDLAVSFGGNEVLSEITMTLFAGDQIALVGRSGSGKSTLLLALAGLLAPTRGQLSWPGLALDPRERRGQVSMVFQAPSLVPELTAVQNVALPLRLRGAARAAAYQAAEDALAEVGLPDVAQALPDELSGGQQQRVALARAIAPDPMVLLADEPTGALDTASARHALGVLQRRTQRRGGVLLMATHDPELAGLLPGRLELHDGRLGCTGTGTGTVERGSGWYDAEAPVQRVRL